MLNYIDISTEWNKTNIINNNSKTFLDIFSGCGGMSLGLVLSGWKPIGAIEINKAAIETYKNNFSFGEIIFNLDITKKETKKKIINHYKNISIDLICGGFPCQGFSLAGKRNLEDTRNSLYYDMLEIVSELSPKYLFMENVSGILSMNKGLVLKKILNDYDQLGYDLDYQLLNSVNYEVPQLRKRVIFIGNNRNEINLYPLPIITDKTKFKTIEDSISDIINLNENKNFNHIFTKHSNEMIKNIGFVKEGESLYKNFSDSWKRCYWKQPSNTIKENHGGVNIHPLLNRVMTPRELARIQSFPDNFIFYGTKSQQLVQIGNAVPPLLSKSIGLSILKMRNENEK